MLRPRIIPCLLIHQKGLVKTIKFSNPKYVGDPINAVRIFNEKEVDELFVIDIDATLENREPDYNLIEHLAAECRMPLCYGGGVKTCEQVSRIIGLGVEKVALSSAAIENPDVIRESAAKIGNQSIIVVLDIMKEGKQLYKVYTHNSTRLTKIDPFEFAVLAEKLGAGEIVINSINNDGVMCGYDFDLVRKFRMAVNMPISVLGGAGSLNDIASLFDTFGIIGAAAGSIFVFKGVYKAVLINYPDRSVKDQLMKRS